MAHMLGFCIGYMIEGFAIWFYSALFREKTRTSHRLVMLFSSYAVLAFVGHLDFKVLNTFIFLTANFLFFFLNFKLKWFTALFHSLFFTALVALSEIIIYGLMNYITPNFFFLKESYYYMISYAIYSKVPLLLIVLAIVIIGRLMRPKGEKSGLTLLYLIVPFASVFCMLVFIAILDWYQISGKMEILICVSSTILLLANLGLFVSYFLMQRRNEEYLELQLNYQKEMQREDYYELLREQNENQRILVHDMKNHLQTIAALNKSGKGAEVQKYIEDLSGRPELTNRIAVTDHELLNLILHRYKADCQKKNIKFFTDIRKGSVNCLEDSEITTIFCNLLDNAMEAAEGCDGAFIDVSAAIKEGTEYLVITIANSCSENPFESDGKTLRPSKKEGKLHGYGLKSVRRVLSKHDGDMESYYDDEKKVFHTAILLR